MEHYASVRATKLNQNQKKNDLNQMSRSTNEEPLSDQNTEISDTGTWREAENRGHLCCNFPSLINEREQRLFEQSGI